MSILWYNLGLEFACFKTIAVIYWTLCADVMLMKPSSNSRGGFCDLSPYFWQKIEARHSAKTSELLRGVPVLLSTTSHSRKGRRKPRTWGHRGGWQLCHLDGRRDMAARAADRPHLGLLSINWALSPGSAGHRWLLLQQQSPVLWWTRTARLRGPEVPSQMILDFIF